VALIVASPAAAQQDKARPTIVVVPFDTDRTGWMPPPEFGTTLSELLGDRLVESGKYRVMDYSWLVDPGRSGGRPPLDYLSQRATDAGVDYLVLGSVTRYSTENHRRGGGVAGFVPFIGGGGRTRVETVMSLTIRVIDARTGEIVTKATPEGMSSRKNVTLGGLAAGIGPRTALLGAGGALFSSSSSRSREALVDEATQEALDLGADALVSAVARLIRSPSITRSPDHPMKSGTMPMCSA
jgi:curli biogenesis system outer membrane secretion channel CsgG